MGGLRLPEQRLLMVSKTKVDLFVPSLALVTLSRP
jgi:hypothetical protein